MIKLTDEEKDTLSYDDVAYLILGDENCKYKVHDLFKKVICVMGLDDSVFEDNIGEFYELIITDKRFVMLDGGFVDLKSNHSVKMIIDEDEDEEIVLDSDDEIISDEDNYDDESNPEDTDTDLQDLVIIDDDEMDSDMM